MAFKRVEEVKPDDYVYINDLIKSGDAWYPGYKGVALGEDMYNDAFLVYAENMWLLVDEVDCGENIVCVQCEEYAFVANKGELVEYTNDL